MVRAADCRSTGPWFKSGCALGLLRFRPWRLAAASCAQRIFAKVLKMPSTPGQSTAFSTCASLCFESVGRPPPVFSWCHTARSLVAHSASLGYIAQWSERLTADQQVPGSNPGVPSLCVFVDFARVLTSRNINKSASPSCAPCLEACGLIFRTCRVRLVPNRLVCLPRLGAIWHMGT